MLNFGILLSNIIASIIIDDEPVRASLCVPKDYDFDKIIGLDRRVNLISFEQVPWSSEEFVFKTFVAPEAGTMTSPSTMTYPKATHDAMDIVLADVWVLMTARFIHGPIIPLKPYVVYAPDFIQRIVPEIYGSDPLAAPWVIDGWQSLALQRSQGVFVTSAQTARDAVSYAGLPSSKIQVLPMANAPLFQPLEDAEARSHRKMERLKINVKADLPFEGLIAAENRATIDPKQILRELRRSGKPYFLWVTNTAQHKNHMRALKALEIYYECEAGQLVCVMCGPNTNWFSEPSSYPSVDAAYRTIQSSTQLTRNLLIVGELGTTEYRDTLADAAFLWYNVLYDNGTFSVIEAARLGTRSLASRYPQMLEIVDNFEINAETFDPWDPQDAARGLKTMERALSEGEAGATWRDKPEDADLFREKLTSLLSSAVAHRAEKTTDV